MDAIKNLAKVEVTNGYNSTATTIVLSSGDGAKLPAPATDGEFNLVWWNSTDYPDPSDDPNVEIVRCTAKTNDTLTVTRGQEGITATAKDEIGKTYKMILSLTKKVMDDLQKAETIEVEEIGTATYDDVQDWIKTTQSAGKLTGGAITDNGDGTVAVTSGTGFIKTTDSDTGESKFFDWSANSSLSLTDNDTNYIYIEYNAGSPQVAVSTTMPSDKNTNVMLGLGYREGTVVHIISAGQYVANYAKNTLWKDLEINGKFQRASGMIISETGTRNFAMTAGSIYAGLTKVTMSAFDSSGSDTFTYMYRDGSGGYTKITSQSQVDNTHYDDGTGTLATLSDGSFWTKYYGVHWVYMDADGDTFVLYGRGDYTLSEAQSANPPSSIPDLLADIGGLVGKIIIEKNASSFTSIQSAFEQTFSPTSASEHNSLAGLQGGASDDYYHLTNTNHTDLTDSGDTSLHYHSTDRDRANHTGTQTASTISDFDTEVSNNTDVTANTAKVSADGSITTHSDVYSSMSPTDGQVLTYDTTNGWQAETLSGSSIFESVNTDSLIREATNTNQYNRDFLVGSPQLDDDGNTAHDKRFFFDKSKGAFRVGIATGTQWDASDVGDYSFACGYNSTASGSYSHAEGYSTIASGVLSHAEGNNTTASGGNSHAEGRNTTASGADSHAEGYNTTASASYSHAEGGSTTASGSYSHAEGSSTEASGYASHAEGSRSEAYLYYQHAHASGYFSDYGDAQYSNNVVRRITTDATQTELTLDGGTPDATSRLILPANRTWLFKVSVVARQTAGTAGTVGDSAGYTYKGLIKRDGSSNTVIQGNVTENIIDESDNDWSVSVEADNTNNCLVVKVTGEVNKTIHWVAKVELVEVG